MVLFLGTFVSTVLLFCGPRFKDWQTFPVEAGLKSENIYIEYLQLIRELEEFERNKIPLCAAETTCSPFVRSALGGIFEGKYCMNHNKFLNLRCISGNISINQPDRVI